MIFTQIRMSHTIEAGQVVFQYAPSSGKNNALDQLESELQRIVSEERAAALAAARLEASDSDTEEELESELRHAWLYADQIEEEHEEELKEIEAKLETLRAHAQEVLEILHRSEWAGYSSPGYEMIDTVDVRRMKSLLKEIL